MLGRSLALVVLRLRTRLGVEPAPEFDYHISSIRNGGYIESSQKSFTRTQAAEKLSA